MFGILVLSVAGGAAKGRKRGPASVFSLLDVFPDLQGSLSLGGN